MFRLTIKSSVYGVSMSYLGATLLFSRACPFLIRVNVKRFAFDGIIILNALFYETELLLLSIFESYKNTQLTNQSITILTLRAINCRSQTSLLVSNMFTDWTVQCCCNASEDCVTFNKCYNKSIQKCSKM